MHKILQIPFSIILAMATAPAFAESFVELNQKIITVRESGFGPEGKAEKFAGIKLDTKAPLVAGCAWDIIAFDPTTEVGKITLKELIALSISKTPLKSISFTRDAEGDCYLEKYEK
jgi:hypothetical protein